MTRVVHNYRDIPGAIPIPATLSLELGKVISEQQRSIEYRFVSDFPFKNRTPHALDEFETAALGQLRQNSNQRAGRVAEFGHHRGETGQGRCQVRTRRAIAPSSSTHALWRIRSIGECAESSRCAANSN